MSKFKLTPTRMIGPYQLGDQIGRGFYGTVHKAINVETGDFVAIKTLDLSKFDASKLGTIENEIRILKKLRHPHVVSYLNFIKDGDNLHIVLEFVESGSMHDVIKKFGILAESLIQIYTRQVLDGLAFLHAEGVIHRDLKASNILLTKDGECKLADFGTSCYVEDTEEERTSIVGSPYWMAPEVLALKGISQFSDIWSLGCTVVEMLTGLPPYGTLDPVAAMFKISQNPEMPPLPVEISDELNDFLEKCFDPVPEHRFTAKQLLYHPFLTKPMQPSRARFRTVHDVQQILQMFSRQPGEELSGSRRGTILVDVNPSQVREKHQRAAPAARGGWQPALRTSVDSETATQLKQLFQQLDEQGEELAANTAQDDNLESVEQLREALKQARAAHAQSLQITKTIHEHHQQLLELKGRAQESAMRYKAIADEAVADRRLVLQRLKTVQDQWKPSLRFNELQHATQSLQHSVDMYNALELSIDAFVLATAIFSDLSVEHIRSSFNPTLISSLSKQSIKSANGTRKSNWKTRLFVLVNNFLFYYRSDRDPMPAGVLHLNRYAISLEEGESEAHQREVEVTLDLKKEKIHETIADWYGTGSWDKTRSPRKSSRVTSGPKRYCWKLVRDDTTYRIGCESRILRDQWYNAATTCKAWYHVAPQGTKYFTKAKESDSNAPAAAGSLAGSNAASSSSSSSSSSSAASSVPTVPPPDFF